MLKDCFKKFGKALSEKDKAAITQMVADGMGEQEAVDSYIAKLKAQLEALKSGEIQTLFQAQKNALGLFSAVEQAILEMDLQQWKAGKPANAKEIWAKVQKTKGVKKEELEQLDLETYLQTKETFSRDEVAQFIRDNGVVLKEIVKGGKKDSDSNTELDWGTSEVQDDSENWQNDFETYMEEFDNKDFQDVSITEWMFNWARDNINTTVKYYSEQLSDEQKKEIDKILAEPKTSGASYTAEGKTILIKLEDWGFDFQKDLRDEARDDYEAVANEKAQVGYFDNPIYIWSEANTNMYIVGNDEGYSIFDGNWRDHRNQINTNEIYSEDEARIQAKAHAIEAGYIDDAGGGETQFETYLNNERDYENYQERLITLPEVEGTFVKSGHFSERNVVSFSRVTDKKLAPQSRALTEEEKKDSYSPEIEKMQAQYAEFYDNPEKEKEIYEKSKQAVIDIYKSKGLTPDQARLDNSALWGNLVSEVTSDSYDERAEIVNEHRDYWRAKKQLSDDIVSASRKYNSDKAKLERAGYVEKSHRFIDEFQSDWHQAGRKKGYRKGLSQEQRDALYKENLELGQKLELAIKPYRRKYNETVEAGVFNERDFLQVVSRTAVGMKAEKIHEYVSVHTDDVKSLQDFLAKEDLTDLYKRHQEDFKKLIKLRSDIREENEGVADAPFKNDAWIALGLKRELIDAIEGGYDHFSWADSQMLADRWSREYLELYENQYDKKMPSIVQKLTGVKPERFVFENDAAYGVVDKKHTDILEKVSKAADEMFLEVAEKLGATQEEIQNKSITVKAKVAPQEHIDYAKKLSDKWNKAFEKSAEATKTFRDFRAIMVDKYGSNFQPYIDTDKNKLSKEEVEKFRKLEAAADKAFDKSNSDRGAIDEEWNKFLEEKGYHAFLAISDAASGDFGTEYKDRIVDMKVMERAVTSKRPVSEWAVYTQPDMIIPIIQEAIDKRMEVVELGRSRDYAEAINASTSARMQVGYWTIPITPELKEQIIGKGFPLYQKGEDESRGSLSIMPDGSRVLKRSHKGDASTIPHELAHLFLEVEKQLERDFGRTENQAALLRWLGVNEFSQITTEHHEKFAETFEVYLQEGKAPSMELRETFRKFRTWITNVYKIYKKDPRFRADLSDESRYIFDRMLATEEQIAAMQSNPAFTPLFRTKEQAGMTDEQYAEYLKNPDKAKSKAQERLDVQIMEQLRKRKTKEWKEEKEYLIQEEITRLQSTMTYRAIAALKVSKLQIDALREHLGIPAPLTAEERNVPDKMDSVLTLAAKLGGLDMGQWSGQGTLEEITKKGNEVRALMKAVENTDENNPKSLEKWIGHTPKSLQSFIIDLGGFTISKSPEAIEALKGRDINVPRLLKHFPKKDGVTHSTDDIALAVVEAGYFEATQPDGRISFGELMDALEQSIVGEKIYTIEDKDAINSTYRKAQKDYEYYSQLNLNNKSTNEEIALATTVKDDKNIDVNLLKDRELNNKLVGSPLFRKNSGMGKAELVEALKEYGFGDYITIDNVTDAVFAELGGENLISPEGQQLILDRDRALAEQGTDAQKLEHLTKFVKAHGRKDGQDPELVMDYFGYKTVQEMIDDVAFAKPIKELAEENAEAMMQAEHGDILNDGTIEREVEEAMQNEEQAALVLAEIKALGRKAKKPDRINREELKIKAKELIGTMKNSEIKPDKFYRASMKAAQKAGQAKTDDERLQAKIVQLANHYLYKEALLAKDTLNKQFAYVKKMQTRTWKPNEVGGDYRRILTLVSNMYDAKKQPMDDVMAAISWFNTQVADEGSAYANVLDHNLLAVMQAQVDAKANNEEFNPSGYKFPRLADLTVDEMDGLYVQLRHLRWMGGKLAEGKKGIDALERTAFAESIIKNGGKDFKDDKGIPDKDQSLKRDGRHFWYKNFSLLNLTRTIDGDFKNDDGLAFKKIFMDVESANSKKIAINGEMYDLMKKELSDIYKLSLNRKKTIYKLESGREIPLGSEHRFMMALYWGTESSRQAIMDGYGMTENDVMKILSTMSVAELNTVNQIWKINEHLWPRLRDTIIRHEGVAPPKLEATPFEVKGIKMTGGHQTLIYDSMELEAKSENQKASNSSKIMPSKSAASHARIGSGGRPVLLELSNITRAIDDNVHYIAFADTGARIRSLINSKEVKAAIEKKHGVGFHKALVEQIDSISGNSQVKGEIRWVTRALRHLRGAATARHLMYSIRNTLQQSSGLPVAMQEVGPKAYISSVSKFLTLEGMQQNIAFVDKLSPYMQERASVVNREASENIRKLSLENTLLKKTWQAYLDHGFMPQTFVDATIAYPLWIARYEKALEEHGNQAKAVVQADNSVAEAVGSGSDLHLGGFFQSNNTETIKGFTMFGSFFNAYLQRMYRDTEGFSTVKSKEAMYTLVTTPIIVAAMSSAIIMDLPDDESDDEEWLVWIAKQYAKFMGGTMIFVRDAVSYGIGGFTPQSPYAGAIEGAGGLANVAIEICDADSERTTTENINDVIKGVASFIKIPASSNVTRVLDYSISNEKGNEDTENTLIQPYQAVVEGRNKN